MSHRIKTIVNKVFDFNYLASFISSGRRMSGYVEVKHSRNGEAQPALIKGSLRLYSMRFCPFAQRVHLVLDIKNIKYDVVNVDLIDKPEWIFHKSLDGKVPAIEFENGETLYESLIISNYLDEVYSDIPLFPNDPLEKAKDKLLIERFNKVISSIHRMVFNPDKFNEENMEQVKKYLDVFEQDLQTRASLFFGGTKPGMLDLMIWPWCERFEILQILGGDLFVLTNDRFPGLLSWHNRMKCNEFVKKSYITPEDHVKYVNSRLVGRADFDLLLAKL